MGELTPDQFLAGFSEPLSWILCLTGDLTLADPYNDGECHPLAQGTLSSPRTERILGTEPERGGG